MTTQTDRHILQLSSRAQPFLYGTVKCNFRLLTLFFDFAFEKSLHGVFCGHIQGKLSFAVHRSDVGTMLYQVS